MSQPAAGKMAAERINVEWATVPDEWMIPAAIVFSNALHQSYSEAAGVDEDSIVIHISCFRESARPSKTRGTILPSLPPGTQQLIAEPMIYVANSELLLNTRCGTFLWKGDVAGICMGLLAIMALLLDVLDPGHSHMSSGLMEFDRRNEVTVLTLIALMLVIFFLMGHVISKHLLKLCLPTFHVVLILFYSCVSEFTLLFEYLTMLKRLGKIGGIKILAMTCYSVCNILVAALVGVSDAILVKVRYKALMSFCLALGLAYTYWNYHGAPIGYGPRICLNPHFCASTTAIFMSSTLSRTLFVLRLFGSYVSGSKYALVQPIFVDPNRESTFTHLFRTFRFCPLRSKRRAGGTVCDLSCTQQDVAQIHRKMTVLHRWTVEHTMNSNGTAHCLGFSEPLSCASKQSIDCPPDVAEEVRSIPPCETQKLRHTTLPCRLSEEGACSTASKALACSDTMSTGCTWENAVEDHSCRPHKTPRMNFADRCYSGSQIRSCSQASDPLDCSYTAPQGSTSGEDRNIDHTQFRDEARCSAPFIGMQMGKPLCHD